MAFVIDDVLVESDLVEGPIQRYFDNLLLIDGLITQSNLLMLPPQRIVNWRCDAWMTSNLRRRLEYRLRLLLLYVLYTLS
jgi:hypothetical protein